MTPFPGESAPLDWARVTAGSPFTDDGDAIRFRAGSATVTAGDAFVAGFFDHRYLEAGADAVFSVVVETLAGSSGTLALSGGPDAAWSLLDGPASTYGLGSHTISGAQTLVVALPWVTVADYLAEAVETAVRVECTSGSVVVQQVKLRIWPPAGVAGGWSANPYVQAPQDANPSILTEAGDIGTLYPSQADFRAALAARVTTAVGVSANGIAYSQMIAVDTDGNDVGGYVGVAYLARPGGNLTGPGFEEEAWIVPPAEVWGDDDRVIFQPTGEDGCSWLQPVATVVMAGDPPISESFHIDGEDITARPPAGTNFLSLAVGTTIATADPAEPFTDVTLPEFDNILRVSVWHPGHFADTPEVGGTQARLSYGITRDELSWDRLLYRWTPAPYRYWSPTVARRYPHQIFQRGDGLGAGPALVYKPGTRQSTGLVFGTY